MESIQSIKKRIRGVSSTQKITKAMEMVSAQKMRRSQEIALSSRPYAIRGLELLAELSSRAPHIPALMMVRPVRRTLILIVAADKGLAGALNSGVFRRAEELLGKNLRRQNSYGELLFATVGKKASEFLARKGISPVRSFAGFGDYGEVRKVEPLSEFLTSGYEKEEWDRVVVLSMHFRTTLKQEVLVREILPVTGKAIIKTVKEIVPEYGRYANAQNGNGVEEHLHPHTAGGVGAGFEYLIEPEPLAVLENLTRHLVTMAVYHLVLEANASEHSARMVAMKSASDNAEELIGTLTLHYNKARQAAITKELAEIVGGAEALKA